MARRLGLILLLIMMMVIAFIYDEWFSRRETFTAAGQKIHISDGDSFAIARHRMRIEDIDAPELDQNCTAANGQRWACGRAAKASLEKLLLSPGLVCTAGAADQFGRSIVTCSITGIADIGAEQVRTGMAVSHEYMTMRTYGDQEDEARAAKRGIWQGDFTAPSEWRAAHPTLRTKTLPTE